MPRISELPNDIMMEILQHITLQNIASLRSISLPNWEKEIVMKARHNIDSQRVQRFVTKLSSISEFLRTLGKIQTDTMTPGEMRQTFIESPTTFARLLASLLSASKIKDSISLWFLHRYRNVFRKHETLGRYTIAPVLRSLDQEHNLVSRFYPRLHNPEFAIHWCIDSRVVVILTLSSIRSVGTIDDRIRPCREYTLALDAVEIRYGSFALKKKTRMLPLSATTDIWKNFLFFPTFDLLASNKNISVSMLQRILTNFATLYCALIRASKIDTASRWHEMRAGSSSTKRLLRLLLSLLHDDE
jgi:hypothetical protein